jgi:glycopeptide antibiotics resistance protein
VKALARAVFAAYLVVLFWALVFKFSIDPAALFGRDTRTLNLLPFTDFSRNTVREILYNVVIFVPFGLLLGVTPKRATMWRTLALISSASLAIELLQFVFALGVTDVTDLITNSVGGLLGLILYRVGNRAVGEDKLDRGIVIAGLLGLVLCLALLGLLLSNTVRYRTAR